jgi:hypothetical protein
MSATTAALVLYESALGRTRSLAEAIADVIRGTAKGRVACEPLRGVTRAAVERTRLLVVGVPTLVPHARAGTIDLTAVGPLSASVERWLAALPPGFGRACAVFDTRPDVRAQGAADVVAARLQDEGYVLVARPIGFLVDGPVGSLPPEQWLRARTWASSRLPAGLEAASSA